MLKFCDVRNGKPWRLVRSCLELPSGTSESSPTLQRRGQVRLSPTGLRQLPKAVHFAQNSELFSRSFMLFSRRSELFSRNIEQITRTFKLFSRNSELFSSNSEKITRTLKHFS